MKIGFIGLGNMATAMIGGMLQKGIAKPEDIIGSSKTETTAEKVKTKFNINTTTDNTAVAEQADILFLAVKPIFFPEVIAEIKDAVKADTLIVSIAAGRNLQYLKDAFGRPELKLIRCMPNTPALVLEGCTGVCIGENVTEDETEQVLSLLRSFGIASVVPERLMDVVVESAEALPHMYLCLLRPWRMKLWQPECPENRPMNSQHSPYSAVPKWCWRPENIPGS